MFDYSNLSPNEFEVLCADLLSRELGVTLRYFSAGRDGGIDLTDSPSQNNIVVQVKHYIKSTFSQLKRSLGAELIKLAKMNPKPKVYYICTSQELTAANIAELYEMFKDYMESDNNIFTKNEIDQLLNSDINRDILRKNFKLWLLADQLLNEIINRSTFIDGEVLLANIAEEFRYFVQTQLFEKSLEVLEKERKLLLCGDPGTGKSITSKMLTLYFVKQGYKIRYTSNGLVSDLKRSLQDNKDLKEVILLDDCLGQYYLKLKEWQDTELISLIDYITINKNKILILNSRVTVLNEARNRFGPLRRYIDDDKLKIKVINMNNISDKEKALIFYNHLIRNSVPAIYYDSIRENKKYNLIVGHKNYNPRIIEYVTHKVRYENVTPETYFDFIMSTLNNPKEAWNEEFTRGLAIEDRIFMYTLFSLTDTFIDLEILRECFYKRISIESGIDSTLDIFEDTKIRLNKSLIRIVIENDVLKVGVLNPSINDYMHNELNNNIIGSAALINCAVYIEQVEKISGDLFDDKLTEFLKSDKILELKSMYSKIPLYIINYICKEEILNINYDSYLEEGLNLLRMKNKRTSKTNKKEIVLFFFKNKNIREFYKILDKVQSYNFVKSVISGLGVEDLEDIILELENLGPTLEEDMELIVEDFIKYDLIDAYLNDVESYIEDYELIKIIEKHSLDELLESKKYHLDERYNSELAYLKQCVNEELMDEILEIVSKVSKWKSIEQVENDGHLQGIIDRVYVKVDSELVEIVDSFYEDEWDYESYYERKSSSFEADEVDIILNRPIG